MTCAPQLRLSVQLHVISCCKAALRDCLQRPTRVCHASSGSRRKAYWSLSGWMARKSPRSSVSTVLVRRLRCNRHVDGISEVQMQVDVAFTNCLGSVEGVGRHLG